MPLPRPPPMPYANVAPLPRPPAPSPPPPPFMKPNHYATPTSILERPAMTTSGGLPDLPSSISLDIFVGNLPTDINDSYVRNILETCGPIEKWKRVIDPVTNDQLAFGFVWYKDIRSVLSALELLNGFSIDSRSLILKLDTETQEEINGYVKLLTNEMHQEQAMRNMGIQMKLKALSDERSGQHGGKQNDVSSWGELVDDEGEGQRNLVLREVEKFRKAQEEKRRNTERQRREEVKRKLRKQKEDREREEEEKKRKLLEEEKEKAAKAAGLTKAAAPETDAPPSSRSSTRPELVPLRRPIEDASKVVIIGLKGKKEKPSAPASVAPSGFNAAEALESKPQRELVPLDYTDEEKLATASLQDRLASVSQRAMSEMKALVDQVPTSLEGLCAYKMDWSIVESRHLVDSQMAPWVSKRVKEYLGEADQGLIDFLLDQLRNKVDPQYLLQELKLVLEKDAETFVKLLWRKLIFEMLRAT